MAFNSSGNNIQKTAPVVMNLIIINGLFFLAQLMVKGNFDFTEWGSLHYYKSPLFNIHQLVTYMFMHDPTNFGHILFNMFGLWMFGTTMERFLGSKKFLIFYLVCGIGAGIFEQFLQPYSALQISKSSAEFLTQGIPLDVLVKAHLFGDSSLGASGAIMGVLAGFAYLFPNTSLYIMFIPVPVKAKFVIPVFILIDLFGGLYHIEGDNIGHFAHLGGAIIGFLLIYFWNKMNRKTFY